MQKFDSKIHDVNFKSILENDIMREALFLHMNSELNSEGLIFFLEVKKYTESIELKDIEEQKKEFKRIYLKFFSKGSDFELNVQSKIKQKIKKKYEQIEEKKNLNIEIKYMKKVSEIVCEELSLDTVQLNSNKKFPRFLRSKYFEKAISKINGYGEVYFMKDIVSYPYKDEDFIKNQLTNKDKSFLRSLLNDNLEYFELSYTKRLPEGSINTYFSTNKFLPNVNFLKIKKGDISKRQWIIQISYNNKIFI
jgi:hypothetical protein